MELHLKIIGWILVILALVHAIFPQYFNWSKELNSLSLINREIMYVHTFFIGLAVLLMGILCLTSSTDLVETDFGKRISFGLGLFWLMRLFVQFFGYSSELWKGKAFETIVHIIFSFLWTYITVVFLIVYWR